MSYDSKLVYTPHTYTATFTIQDWQVGAASMKKRVAPLKGVLIVDADLSASLTRLEWKGEWYKRVTRRGRNHYFRRLDGETP